MSTTAPDSAPEVAALPGAISRDAEGWVTASPPRAADVLRRVFGFPSLLLHHRDLVMTSVKRELQARFTGTVLGMAWPLVTPVFLFLVYYFIFTKLLAVKFGELPEEQKNAMGVFMFIGILVWTAFGDALIRCCSSILDNGNLIKKLVFPAELLPLNIVLVNAVTMGFGIAIYLLVVVVSNAFMEVPFWYLPDPRMLLWIPVLLFLQCLFTFGVGLILSTLQVFLRDTLQILGTVVTVWMFVTPIFWTPELVMGPQLARLRSENPGVEDAALMAQTQIAPFLDFILINPMQHIVLAWRHVLMRAEPAMIFEESLLAPDLVGSILTFTVWSLGVYAVGYAFFVLAQRRFADEV